MNRITLLASSSHAAIGATLPLKRTVSSPDGQFNLVIPWGMNASIDDGGRVTIPGGVSGSMKLTHLSGPPRDEPAE